MGLGCIVAMRVFQTSDTHLGHQQYPRTDAQGLNQREQDIYAAWHAVIDAAVLEKPDLFVHAGDLFDGVRPSNRALAHALEGFLKLSRAGIPTVVIAGNHEHPKMRETGSPFRLFEHLDHIHPVYKGRRETIPLPTADGQRIVVHAVPQCADAETLEQEIQAIQADPDAHNILVLHGAVHSIQAFSHAEFNELTLNTQWFDDRFDHVALGHYHGVTEVTPRTWYCGAPERVSIAESGQEKGYLDIQLDPYQVTFQALPTRAYTDLPILDAATLDADGIIEAAQKALQKVPEGAVCRLRIHNLEPSLRGILDRRAIQQAAAHTLHLDLKIELRDTDHRVRGEAQLGNLQEEFDAFAAHHPIEGLDRKRLLDLARQTLREAEP